MNKNLLEELKNCTGNCEDCIWCIDRCEIEQYKKVASRLEELIDDCNIKERAERLITVVYTLYCLGIITDRDADEYTKKLVRRIK